jgi:hypothetical protein
MRKDCAAGADSYTGLLQETARNCAIPPEAIALALEIGAALILRYEITQARLLSG